MSAVRGSNLSLGKTKSCGCITTAPNPASTATRAAPVSRAKVLVPITILVVTYESEETSNGAFKCFGGTTNGFAVAYRMGRPEQTTLAHTDIIASTIYGNRTDKTRDVVKSPQLLRMMHLLASMETIEPFGAHGTAVKWMRAVGVAHHRKEVSGTSESMVDMRNDVLNQGKST